MKPSKADQIPNEWRESPELAALGVAVLFLGFAGAVAAFLQSSIYGEAAGVSAGLTGLTALLWMSRKGSIVWFIVAVVGSIAALLALGGRVLPIVWILAALGWVALVIYRDRKRDPILRRRASAANTLRSKFNDTRPAIDVIKFRYRSSRPIGGGARGKTMRAMGLPIVWNFPPDVVLTVVDRRDVRYALQLLFGGPLAIEWREWRAIITVPREGREAETSGMGETGVLRKDVQRLSEALKTAIGPDVIVTKTKRTGTSEGLVEFRVNWPPTYAARLSQRFRQVSAVRAVGTVLGGSWRANWNFDEDHAIFGTVPGLPELLEHPGPTQTLRAEFAQIRSGGCAALDLEQPEHPHVLVTGKTRSGKASALRSILVALPHGTRIWLADPNRISLKGLERIPGVEKIFNRAESMVEMVQDAEREMEKIYDDLEHDRITVADLTPRVYVIEDCGQFANIVNAHWNTTHPSGERPSSAEHPALESLRALLRLGGQARIFVVVSARPGDVSWLGAEVRQNFGVRVALGNLEAEASNLVFGSDIATAGLEQVTGRAWIAARDSSGGAEQAQIFWVPALRDSQDPEDVKRLERLGLIPRTQSAWPGVGYERPGEDTSLKTTSDESLLNGPLWTQPSGPGGGNPGIVEHVTEANQSHVKFDEVVDSGETAMEAAIRTELVDVIELEEGQKILVDLGKGDISRAEVMGVEIDSRHPDQMEIHYATDTESGVMAIPDTERVERIIQTG